MAVEGAQPCRKLCLCFYGSMRRLPIANSIEDTRFILVSPLPPYARQLSSPLHRTSCGPPPPFHGGGKAPVGEPSECANAH
jgi:hypothetical protein